MRKITAALSAGIVALLASSVEGKDHCRKPLPRVTDENFGAELYQKVKHCTNSIPYLERGRKRIVFISKGVRYTLDISPTLIQVFFRKDGTSHREDYGIVSDSADDDFPGSRSSNKLDSICELVGVSRSNGLISEQEVPIGLRSSGRPGSDDLFHYGFGKRGDDSKSTPQDYAFAQSVCQRVLNEVREFYNRSVGRKK